MGPKPLSDQNHHYLHAPPSQGDYLTEEYVEEIYSTDEDIDDDDDFDEITCEDDDLLEIDEVEYLDDDDHEYVVTNTSAGCQSDQEPSNGRLRHPTATASRHLDTSFFEGEERHPSHVNETLTKMIPGVQSRILEGSFDAAIEQSGLGAPHVISYAGDSDESSYDYVEELDEDEQDHSSASEIILPISKYDRRSFFSPPSLSSINEASTESDSAASTSSTSSDYQDMMDAELKKHNLLLKSSTSTVDTTEPDLFADDIYGTGGSEEEEDEQQTGKGVVELEEHHHGSSSCSTMSHSSRPQESNGTGEDVLRSIGADLGIDAEAVRGFLQQAVVAMAKKEAAAKQSAIPDFNISDSNGWVAKFDDDEESEAVLKSKKLSLFLESPTRRSSENASAYSEESGTQESSVKSTSKSVGANKTANNKKRKSSSKRGARSVASAPLLSTKKKKKKKSSKKSSSVSVKSKGAKSSKKSEKDDIGSPKSPRRKSARKSDDPSDGKKSRSSSKKRTATTKDEKPKKKSPSKRKSRTVDSDIKSTSKSSPSKSKEIEDTTPVSSLRRPGSKKKSSSKLVSEDAGVSPSKKSPKSKKKTVASPRKSKSERSRRRSCLKNIPDLGTASSIES